MTEYAILAILVYRSAELSAHSRKQFLYWGALAAVFLYACTDEFHQRFVPGRAGLFSDVLIDTLGGFLGLALYLLAGRLFAACLAKRSKKKRNRKR